MLLCVLNFHLQFSWAFLLVNFILSFLGKGGNFLVEKDECLSPYSAADGMCLELPDRGVQSSETTKRLPVIDFCQGQTLLPHSKIKLQLFPVNEGTRIGLEKVVHKS